MHSAFLAFTGLLENHVQPTEICVFGPWLAMACIAFRGGLDLRFAVHLTALATLWPHPTSYACSLCSFICLAQRDILNAVLAGAMMLLYAQHCPCGAPSETQIIAIVWTEAVETAYFIVTRLLAL